MRTLGFILIALTFSSLAKSQAIIEIDPLFEYPVAPEELESLEDKSNYLVEHFWDSFNFKDKSSVDQLALNDAFRVFLTPLQWASMEKANASLDKLIEKLNGNPTLLFQFTKAAEENMYGPRATVWSDDVYLIFLNATLKNKKIPDARKTKFKKQAEIIGNTQLNSVAPKFNFENRQGSTETYFPMSTPTILIFGDPDDTDWRLARLKTETNSALSTALEQGKVNIIFIIPFESDNWTESVSNYSPKWITGKSADIADIYDIRVLPSVYLVGNDGKIQLKNVSLDTAITKILLDLYASQQ